MLMLICCAVQRDQHSGVHRHSSSVMPEHRRAGLRALHRYLSVTAGLQVTEIRDVKPVYQQNPPRGNFFCLLLVWGSKSILAPPRELRTALLSLGKSSARIK